MRVVSASEMRAIDAGCGIAGETLMANAARAALRACDRLTGGGPSSTIVIVAGRGNNGGDGWALARLLAERGASARLFSSCDPAILRGDALVHCERARAAGVSVIGRDDLPSALLKADLVVDALFGTGFDVTRLDDEASALIELVNDRSGRPAGNRILALDMPSGLCADTGRTAPRCVKADMTVTFGRAKRGLYLLPGACLAGEIVVDGIGIPDACFESAPGSIPEIPDIRGILPRRAPDAHKAQSKLLVIGGSEGMAGAVQLAARSALAANAGYVFLALPAGASDHGWPPEAVRRPLPSTPERSFARAAESDGLKLAETVHAVVLGGGMGRGENERALAAKWTRLIPRPLVIDADALRLVRPEDVKESRIPRVLTPHAGEFSALFGGSAAKNEEDRVGAAVAAAARCGHVVLFKGRPTIVASPDGRYAVNPTGDERLATCGSGDALAGVIGALLAQGVGPFNAAVAGAYLHGATVDEWRHPVGLTAGEIARLVPAAWGSVLDGR